MSFIHPNKHKGVAAVIYKKESKYIDYLLLHRCNPWKGWGLLKGRCENNSESYTLRKEMKEEARLKENIDYFNKDIHRIQGLRIAYTTPQHRRMDYQVYTVKVLPKTIVKVDNRENDGHKWTNFREAARMLRHEESKQTLEAGNEFIKSLEEDRRITRL